MKKIFSYWETWLVLSLNSAVLILAIIEKNVLGAIWVITGTWWFFCTLYYQDKSSCLRAKCAALECELLRSEVKRYGVELKNMILLKKEVTRQERNRKIRKMKGIKNED